MKGSEGFMVKQAEQSRMQRIEIRHRCFSKSKFVKRTDLILKEYVLIHLDLHEAVHKVIS